MAKYLISFPSAPMVVPDGEWEAVGRDAHAVIDEAKAAGVYVFGGGIDALRSLSRRQSYDLRRPTAAITPNQRALGNGTSS
jgi:hypothetical protein